MTELSSKIKQVEICAAYRRARYRERIALLRRCYSDLMKLKGERYNYVFLVALASLIHEGRVKSDGFLGKQLRIVSLRKLVTSWNKEKEKEDHI